MRGNIYQAKEKYIGQPVFVLCLGILVKVDGPRFFSWPPTGVLVHKQGNKSSSPMQLVDEADAAICQEGA